MSNSNEPVKDLLAEDSPAGGGGSGQPQDTDPKNPPDGDGPKKYTLTQGEYRQLIEDETIKNAPELAEVKNVGELAQKYIALQKKIATNDGVHIEPVTK